MPQWPARALPGAICTSRSRANPAEASGSADEPRATATLLSIPRRATGVAVPSLHACFSLSLLVRSRPDSDVDSDVVRKQPRAFTELVRNVLRTSGRRVRYKRRMARHVGPPSSSIIFCLPPAPVSNLLGVCHLYGRVFRVGRLI